VQLLQRALLMGWMAPAPTGGAPPPQKAGCAVRIKFLPILLVRMAGLVKTDAPPKSPCCARKQMLHEQSVEDEGPLCGLRPQYVEALVNGGNGPFMSVKSRPFNRIACCGRMQRVFTTSVVS
jgi:hypothetical protein